MQPKEALHVYPRSPEGAERRSRASLKGASAGRARARTLAPRGIEGDTGTASAWDGDQAAEVGACGLMWERVGHAPSRHDRPVQGVLRRRPSGGKIVGRKLSENWAGNPLV